MSVPILDFVSLEFNEQVFGIFPIFSLFNFWFSRKIPRYKIVPNIFYSSVNTLKVKSK